MIIGHVEDILLPKKEILEVLILYLFLAFKCRKMKNREIIINDFKVMTRKGAKIEIKNKSYKRKVRRNINGEYRESSGRS